MDPSGVVLNYETYTVMQLHSKYQRQLELCDINVYIDYWVIREDCMSSLPNSFYLIDDLLEKVCN